MAVAAELGSREDHLDENLQLIACAGAGKTERVARRVVAQLSLDGINPENQRWGFEAGARSVSRYHHRGSVRPVSTPARESSLPPSRGRGRYLQAPSVDQWRFAI